MQALERKTINIRLLNHDFSKLKEMKEGNFIKNYSRFCEKAVEDALVKKYAEFQEIKKE